MNVNKTKIKMIDSNNKSNHMNKNQSSELDGSKQKMLIDLELDPSNIGKSFFTKDKFDQEKENYSRFSFANEGDFIGKVEEIRNSSSNDKNQEKRPNSNLQSKNGNGGKNKNY